MEELDDYLLSVYLIDKIGEKLVSQEALVITLDVEDEIIDYLYNENQQLYYTCLHGFILFKEFTENTIQKVSPQEVFSLAELEAYQVDPTCIGSEQAKEFFSKMISYGIRSAQQVYDTYTHDFDRYIPDVQSNWSEYVYDRTDNSLLYHIYQRIVTKIGEEDFLHFAKEIISFSFLMHKNYLVNNVHPSMLSVYIVDITPESVAIKIGTERYELPVVDNCIELVKYIHQKKDSIAKVNLTPFIDNNTGRNKLLIRDLPFSILDDVMISENTVKLFYKKSVILN